MINKKMALLICIASLKINGGTETTDQSNSSSTAIIKYSMEELLKLRGGAKEPANLNKEAIARIPLRAEMSSNL